MKSLALLIIFWTSCLTVASANVASIIHMENIDIKVFGNSKVQVFNSKKRMFSADCDNGFLCKLFVTHTPNPKYKIYDGFIEPDDDVLPLTVNNVQLVLDKNNELVFLLSSGNVSGSYSKIQEFLIYQDNHDSEWYQAGAFYRTVHEYSFLRYGGGSNDYALLQ